MRTFRSLSRPVARSPVAKVAVPRPGIARATITKQPKRAPLTYKRAPAKVASMGSRPKGLISSKKTGTLAGVVGGAAQGFITSLPGVGGAIGGALSAYQQRPDGTIGLRRKRRKGLSHRDIQGAVRLLKLVKRFAPAGHKTALRMHRAR